jgi:hypothetical protein
MEAQGKALQAGRLPRPTCLSDNVPPERLTGYETYQTVTTKKKTGIHDDTRSRAMEA